MSIAQMHGMNGTLCSCGKTHGFQVEVISGKGVISQIPELVASYGAKKVYVLSDVNTQKAAGDQVCRLLDQAGIVYINHCFQNETLEPDETSVGSAMMHYPLDADLILTVGSGVLNDIGKIVSAVSGKPYIIVATAPSMDGYASATSSMTRDGLKISLPSRSADVIVGDTEILRQAPMDMMRSGLGDMLAKYVSICEWRISQVITGEYYCEEIASLIRSAVKGCVDNAQGLLERQEAAVQAVFEGLVIGGVAMNYAGLSRPASGVEHYISHVLDMRGAEFGTPVAFHGTQCAVGTLLAVRLYEKLANIPPNKEKALAHAKTFDYAAWSETLRGLLGKGAESMIALEQKEKKYDVSLHARRLEKILSNWEEILEILRQELPGADQLEKLLDEVQLPKSLQELGTEESLFPTVFRTTADIRDKYVLSRLAWDLGITEELLK